MVPSPGEGVFPLDCRCRWSRVVDAPYDIRVRARSSRGPSCSSVEGCRLPERREAASAVMPEGCHNVDRVRITWGAILSGAQSLVYQLFKNVYNRSVFELCVYKIETEICITEFKKRK